MTRSEIFDKISQMIKEQMHHEDMEVTEETSLKDELGVDSIDLTIWKVVWLNKIS